jgi:hypothetical protein
MGILALSWAIHVTYIGELYLSDLVAALLVPFAILAWRDFPRRNSRYLRATRWLTFAAFVWWLAQAIADIVRQSSASNMMRGWANIFFFVSSLLVLRSLLSDQSDFPRFTGMLGLSGILAYALAPPWDGFANAWKFGLGLPASYLAVYVACRLARHSRRRSAALLALLGVIHLLLGYRSMAGICLIASALLVLPARRPPEAGIQGQRLFGKAILASVLATIVGLAAVYAYSWAAAQGILGSDAQSKYEIQQSSGLPVLLAGRADALISGKAIIESPLLGYGSWPDNRELAAEAQALRQRGVALGYSPSDPELIATHSYLLGAWVDAGIFGAVFWVLVIAAIMICLGRRAVWLSSRAAPAVAFFVTNLAWCVLFSPLGADARLAAAVSIVVVTYFAFEFRNNAAAEDPMAGRRGSGGAARKPSLNSIEAWSSSHGSLP